MTFSHAVIIRQLSGGIHYRLGPAMKVSDEAPEAYVRKVIDTNMDPLGSIIQKVEAPGIRNNLHLEGGQILRFYSRDQNASYIYFASEAKSPLAEPAQ
jgi:hypothetical protein